MSHNQYGIGGAPPPPMSPGYPPHPGPPAGRRGRRWPALVAAGAGAALVAAAAAALVTTTVRDSAMPPAQSPAQVTVTVQAPPPPSPAPLPASQADSQTCATRVEAYRYVSEASAAETIIPSEFDILDPEVRANPAWAAGVERAGALYAQAGDTLVVAAGTTPVLADAVATTSNALRALGTSYSTFHRASGNAHDIAKTSSVAMDAICARLAP